MFYLQQLVIFKKSFQSNRNGFLYLIFFRRIVILQYSKSISAYLGTYSTDLNLIRYYPNISTFRCENRRNKTIITTTSRVTPFQIPSDSFTFRYTNQEPINISVYSFAKIVPLRYFILSSFKTCEPQCVWQKFCRKYRSICKRYC